MTVRLTTRQAAHKAAQAGAALRNLEDKIGDSLSVKDFGATGDGTTNDSTAIQSCITAAQAAGKAVLFPAGVYIISSLGTQGGRLILAGDGDVTLKGTLTYSQTFTMSAATLTPVTPTSPYFQAVGINFHSVSNYGLRLLTPEQGGFLTTFRLDGCKFFGPKGLLARQMIGFQLHDCEFNNVIAGARFESCVNGSFTLCRWQNQAESGVWITRDASDVNLAGGENLKFVLCEWAVCTYGLVADQHMWLVLDSCMIDYCAVPLFLSGSTWAKATNTYFGASNHAVSTFSGVSGYVAPTTSGVAVYGRPGGSPTGTRVVGFTAHNCEFINYTTGSSNPIVSIDGYIDGSYPQSGEEVAFVDCLFYATQAHTAGTLLYVNAARSVRVVANRFRSYNLSTSMTGAYILNGCSDPLGHSNSFWNCTQSSVQISSANEVPIGAYVQSTDPGAVGAGRIWVTP